MNNKQGKYLRIKCKNFLSIKKNRISQAFLETNIINYIFVKFHLYTISQKKNLVK